MTEDNNLKTFQVRWQVYSNCPDEVSSQWQCEALDEDDAHDQFQDELGHEGFSLEAWEGTE